MNGPTEIARAALAACIVALLAAAPAAGREEIASEELERIEELVRQANQEVRRFRSAGGEAGSPDNPARRWSDELWRYGRDHPGTEAAALASAEGMHLLVHAERAGEAMALARQLEVSDPAWDRVVTILAEAARVSGDYGFFIERAESLLDSWSDPAAKARLRFSLAEALWQDGSPERARAEFLTVAEESGDAELVAAARGNVHEIDHLAVGQDAPGFTAETRAGTSLSLAELRGDPTLIIFWASW